MILAIDPGNMDSAYVVIDDDLRPTKFDKTDNQKLLHMIREGAFTHLTNITHFAIEMIAHYGKDMHAGKEVFETCVWIGRFEQAMIDKDGIFSKWIYRKDAKMNLCGSANAKDGNIRRVLIDRFAQHDLKNGKGKKDSPDWFYGFHDDIWQAYSVGCTYADLYLNK